MPGEVAETAFGEFSALDLVRFSTRDFAQVAVCETLPPHPVAQQSPCSIIRLQLYQQANCHC